MSIGLSSLPPFRGHRCPRCWILALSVSGMAGWESRAADDITFGSPPPAVAERADSPALSALSLEDLMNVRVSSVTREVSTVGDSPAAVFVVTQEMIHRSGATCIPEVLRMVPGLNVAHLSSNQWVISIRGFDNTLANKLLVQVDGRTVYSPVQSGVFWDTVDYPLEDIERIEVVRGPGGTVWGANAVNGVINIITKSAKDTQGLLVVGGGGSQERGFSTIRFGGKIGDNVNYRAYGKWFERAPDFSPVDLAHDDWRSARAGFRLDWTPGTKDVVTFQGDWFSVIAGQASVASITDVESRGVNVLGRWTHELGKDSNWELQAFYDRFDERSHNASLKFTVDTADIDFHQQFHLGDRNKVIYGFGYRLQKIFVTGTEEADAESPLGGATVDVERTLLSAYLQDEITVVPERVFLTLGSKFEHNDFTGFEYQPSGRLLWKITKKQSVWGSVSRAVRTPDILEDSLELQFSSAAASAASPEIFTALVPNRDLGAESVIAYELGYRAQVTERFSFDTAFFYNRYDRLSVFTNGVLGPGPVPGSLFLPLTSINGMDGETFGAEIASAWSPTNWWKLDAAYSYARLNLHLHLAKTALAALATQDAAEEGETPQHHVYLRSSIDLPHHVQFDLIGRYVDILPGYVPPVKGYLTMDARLAWKPTEKLELAVVGQNLFDDHHAENGSGVPIQVQRGVYGSATIRW